MGLVYSTMIVVNGTIILHQALTALHDFALCDRFFKYLPALMSRHTELSKSASGCNYHFLACFLFEILSRLSLEFHEFGILCGQDAIIIVIMRIPRNGKTLLNPMPYCQLMQTANSITADQPDEPSE